MSQQLWFTVIAFHTIVLFLPFSMLILYRRPKSWNSIFALFLGLVVAFIDLQTDEVQFPALLLLAFGFFLGFAQPKRAWEPATLLGLWVPVVQFVKIFVEGRTELLLQEGLGSLLALGFSFAGTYAGVLLRWLEKQFHPEQLDTNKQS